MRSVFLYICMTLLPAAVTAQQLSLEDIFINGKYGVKSVPGFNVTEDGQHYLKIDRSEGRQEVNRYDLKTGAHKERLYIHKDTSEQLAGYTLNSHSSYILTFSNPQAIYRRSVLYNTSVVRLSDGTAVQLHGGKKVLHAGFSPEGDKVAYVFENNLYVYDIIRNSTVQVTHDGRFNHIINGNCDWVYEEEFSFSQAYEWSPDGSWIAYYKFDESRVKEITMQYYFSGQNYPSDYTFKYPKAGEDNSIVNIYTYHVEKGLTQKMDVGTETDQYIPRIRWAGTKDLCIFRMNRHQNELELLYANPQSGASRTVYRESNKYYVDIHDNIYFLQEGNKILLTSETGGYNHLYIYDVKSRKLKAVTSGKWDLDELVAVDEQQSRVYFTAGIASPKERQLYSVHMNGGQQRAVLAEKGWHNVSATGNKYFLVKHQSATEVPTFRLIDAKGKTVRWLEKNDRLKQQLQQVTLGTLRFLEIPNDEGVALNAYMITPPDFSESKKYPVLMYQYSGPGSQQVADRFQLDHYMWHQYLAQQGYIIVVADGTGTGGRGEEFKKKTYLQLGKLESDDQIAVARYLGALPYVDAARIGIWGWSYGAFMSSTCIFKAPEVFKAAIAVAPVTNWRFYDNIYTERYMRTPAENPEGYDRNAPEQMAAGLKGSFLLIHGLADDNVHFQNAAVLTEQLVRHNKQFRSEYYPNGNHGIGGGVTRFQLYKRMTGFILNEL